MGVGSCRRINSRAVPSNVAFVVSLSIHSISTASRSIFPSTVGVEDRRRRRVTREVEAGDHAGSWRRRRVNGRIFYMDRVEHAVVRVVGIEHGRW